MVVVRSEVMGFCSGVSRAIKMAEDALEQNAGSSKKIYSLGPLIHNAVALADLERRGLKIIDQKEIHSLDKNCIVLIRAHGVAPNVLEQIKAVGAAVIDATCPRVALSQKRAAEYSKKGCTVILAGDAGHGEVEAVKGSAGERFVLVQSAEAVGRGGEQLNAAALALLRGEEALLVKKPQTSPIAVLLAQTTFSPEEFSKIAASLKMQIPNLEILDTICPATQKRQEALLGLCKKVDAVIVIGGKKSANTRRLYEIAQGLRANAFFVESVAELRQIKPALRKIGAQAKIGITAGASTPDFVIEEVERALL